jgi:hypothetical protein
MPFGTLRPHSAARPRMAFASIVCCLSSRDRAECKARIPCCSKLLAGTNFTSGRDAAAQSAAASAASVHPPLFHERLDRFGRDQLHVVSELGQHACPMMCRATRFQNNRADSLLLEEREKLTPSQAKLMGDPSPALRNRWLPLILEQVVKRFIQQVLLQVLLRGAERGGKCLVWFAGPAPVVAHIWEGAGFNAGAFTSCKRGLSKPRNHMTDIQWKLLPTPMWPEGSVTADLPGLILEVSLIPSFL